jgi:hypothetical protein
MRVYQGKGKRGEQGEDGHGASLVNHYIIADSSPIQDKTPAPDEAPAQSEEMNVDEPAPSQTPKHAGLAPRL